VLRVVCSKYWFRPDAVTSPHELIIGSGFDGTGLHVLAEALRILGKAKVAYPAIRVNRCGDSQPYCDESKDAASRIMAEGLQGDGYGPDKWESTDAVMGHPVPLFTWDFLEAFPSAKVILTVRDGNDVWDATRGRWQQTAAIQFNTFSVKTKVDEARLRLWLWGLPNKDAVLHKKQFLRRYWSHNSKIIHGVPRQQLLVWNLYENPSWEPLCEFLGVPVPNVPFPTPQKDEL
jgi:hypothetical protein